MIHELTKDIKVCTIGKLKDGQVTILEKQLHAGEVYAIVSKNNQYYINDFLIPTDCLQFFVLTTLGTHMDKVRGDRI